MYHHLFELSFRYRNHTLISHIFLIRTYQLLLTCFQLPRRLVQNLQPSKLLRSVVVGGGSAGDDCGGSGGDDCGGSGGGKG